VCTKRPAKHHENALTTTKKPRIFAVEIANTPVKTPFHHSKKKVDAFAPPKCAHPLSKAKRRRKLFYI
jgi:hypothetical protein